MSGSHNTPPWVYLIGCLVAALVVIIYLRTILLEGLSWERVVPLAAWAMILALWAKSLQQVIKERRDQDR